MRLKLRKLNERAAAAITSAELPIGLSLESFDLARALVVEPIPRRPWTVLLPAHVVPKTGLDTELLTRAASDGLVAYTNAAGRTRTLLLEIRPSRKRGSATFQLLRDSGGIVAHGRIISRRGGELTFEAAPPPRAAKRGRRPKIRGRVTRDGAFEFKFELKR